MRVYIAQLKCPSNHCVVGMAGEFETDDDAKILSYRLGQMFGEAVKRGLLNHECGICKATNLNVQIGVTAFRSMEEAGPMLREMEAAQAATAALLKSGRN